MSSNRQLATGVLAITGWYVLALWRLVPPASIRGSSLTVYQRWAYRHMAYSDIFALYRAHDLAHHGLMYWQTPLEYPVVMGLIMWISAFVPHVIGFFYATASLLWLSALAAFYSLSRWKTQAAWAFVASPLLLVYGLLNWDVMGIALMCWGLYLFERQRYHATGVVFALAVFFKLFPIFYLPVMAASLLRASQGKPLGRMMLSFAVTALVINGPVALGNWTNWSLFFRYNATRVVSADLWNNAAWHLKSVPWVDGLSLVITLLAGAVAIRAVWRGHSLYSAAVLAFAIFLGVNKVFSPQYMIWLFAFAVIAGYPAWSLIFISIAGLLDYANSILILGLSDHVRSMLVPWYHHQLFSWGLLIRYLALASIPLVSLSHWLGTHRSRDARTPSDRVTP